MFILHAYFNVKYIFCVGALTRVSIKKPIWYKGLLFVDFLIILDI